MCFPIGQRPSSGPARGTLGGGKVLYFAPHRPVLSRAEGTPGGFTQYQVPALAWEQKVQIVHKRTYHRNRRLMYYPVFHPDQRQ